MNALVRTTRPVQPDDDARLQRLFDRLSPETILFRFFSPITRLSSSMRRRLVAVDHDRRDAIVMVDDDEIIAVARYDAVEARVAEIAITVEDAWQRQGIGEQLTRELAELARARDFEMFLARTMPSNRAALGLVRKVFPDANVRFDGGEYVARLPLVDAGDGVSAGRGGRCSSGVPPSPTTSPRVPAGARSG
jgi:ribosomal protein S18 acetylase RimI-like enzyme